MNYCRDTRSFNGRRTFLFVCMALAAVALVWRAVCLQVLDKEFLRSQADARHLRVVSLPAHRGKILDRNGEPLAISTPV